MKKIIFLMISIFITFNAISQEINCEWKSKFTRESATDKSKLIYTAPGGNEFYVLRESASVSDPYLWLEKYTYPAGNEYTKTIPKNEGVFSNNILYENLLVGKDQFLFFYRGWNKEEKKSSWLVRSCTLGGEYTKDAKELVSHVAQNKMKAGNYDISLSPDQSMFAVLMTFPKEKDAKEKISVSVFDSKSLAEKWTKEITTEDESGKGSYDIALDDKANVYCLKRLAEGKVFTYHLSSVNSTSTALKDIPMEIPVGSSIADYKLMMTPAGNLYFTGMYAAAKTNFDVNGSFCVKVNTATQTATSKFNLFTERITNAGVSGFMNMKLKEIVQMPNGSFYIIGENQFDKVLGTKPDATGKPISEVEFQSNKIIVMCYKSDGTRDWEATISKNQSFKANDRWPSIRWDSYISGLVGDKLYFLYNNLNLGGKWKEVSGTEYFRSSFVKAGNPAFMYVLEPNGNVKYGDKMYGLPLFTLYNQVAIPSPSLVPGFGVSTPNGLLIMSGSIDNKQMQLGLVKEK